jgi:hypothetical protein
VYSRHIEVAYQLHLSDPIFFYVFIFHYIMYIRNKTFVINECVLS